MLGHLRPAYFVLEHLFSLFQTWLQGLVYYFYHFIPFLILFSYTSQGHEHCGSFSSLLAIAVAVQSRVCPDYKKFVFLTKNTSFFHAKVSCPCVGLFLSCPSLLLYPLTSSSHSKASSNVFPPILWIQIHIVHHRSCSHHVPDFHIHLFSLIIVSHMFYIDPIHISFSLHHLSSFHFRFPSSNFPAV